MTRTKFWAIAFGRLALAVLTVAVLFALANPGAAQTFIRALTDIPDVSGTPAASDMLLRNPGNTLWEAIEIRGLG